MNHYEEMLKMYLQEKKPKAYRELKRNGELKTYLKKKVDAALEQKQTMLNSGMMENEANAVILHDLMPV